jgi:hypothetical protein
MGDDFRETITGEVTLELALLDIIIGDVDPEEDGRVIVIIFGDVAAGAEIVIISTLMSSTFTRVSKATALALSSLGFVGVLMIRSKISLWIKETEISFQDFIDMKKSLSYNNIHSYEHLNLMMLIQSFFIQEKEKNYSH